MRRLRRELSEDPPAHWESGAKPTLYVLTVRHPAALGISPLFAQSVRTESWRPHSGESTVFCTRIARGGVPFRCGGSTYRTSPRRTSNDGLVRSSQSPLTKTFISQPSSLSCSHLGPSVHLSTPFVLPSIEMLMILYVYGQLVGRNGPNFATRITPDLPANRRMERLSKVRLSGLRCRSILRSIT